MDSHHVCLASKYIICEISFTHTQFFRIIYSTEKFSLKWCSSECNADTITFTMTFTDGLSRRDINGLFLIDI